MILNNEEKNLLVNALKKEYDARKKIIDCNEFPAWVQGREEFVSRTEELKKQIETLENNEICDITINN